MRNKFKFRNIFDINGTATLNSKIKTPNLKFSVLSYNLLADLYCKPSTYDYVKDESYLNKDYRLKQHFEDFSFLKPDIACLQEIEKPTFDLLQYKFS